MLVHHLAGALVVIVHDGAVLHAVGGVGGGQVALGAVVAVHVARCGHGLVGPGAHIRAHVGVVVVRAAGGRPAAVDVARVVVGADVPFRGCPVRHVAGGGERAYGEDGHAGGGVAVHGAAVAVAVDGEAVGIIAGVCPCGAGGDTGEPVAHGGGDAQRHVGIIRAAVQQHGGTGHQGHDDCFGDFHCLDLGMPFAASAAFHYLRRTGCGLLF